MSAVSAALNVLLADIFALYLKTKSFHRHVSGPHFRDYHLMLDEQAEQIFAITDDVAERVRKIGGTTLRSIGHVAHLQRVKDNDADVAPSDMPRELTTDNRTLTANMRAAHEVAAKHLDVAITSLLEVYIDQAERRAWFLFEASRAERRQPTLTCAECLPFGRRRSCLPRYLPTGSQRTLRSRTRVAVAGSFWSSRQVG